MLARKEAINKEALIVGISDAHHDKKLQLSEDEIPRTIKEFGVKMQAEVTAKRKASFRYK